MSTLLHISSSETTTKQRLSIMKKVWRIVPVVLMAVFFFACEGKKDHANEDSNEAAAEANDDKFQTNKAEDDADFVVKAVANNIAEIEIAQLGVQRSDNADIKAIGRDLENEHNKLLKNLQDLAAKKTISIPASGEDADRRKIEDLNKEDEIKDFNKEWCKELVDRHEDSIERFEKCLQNTADPDIKAFINESLPSMRSHLEKVKAVHEKIAEASK
jgi:putative membrane protein